MLKSLYREIWTIRFDKMLKLEEEGVRGYQELLSDARRYFKREVKLHRDLERLVLDEKKHVRLVHELLNLMSRRLV